jgi:UDP-N-acetylglucosamine:LPS N-acetylglucosamine transferase
MRIGLICSHGGHLTEMFELVDAFHGEDVFFVTYDSSRVDEVRRRFPTYTLGNFGTSPIKAALSLPTVWHILRQTRPDVLVSTGAEIALPFFLVAKILRIKTVFVETTCRVRSASKTGRLLYPLADIFFVQWPEMLSLYGPRARYEGGLL